jgi:hypothetical protein
MPRTESFDPATAAPTSLPPTELVDWTKGIAPRYIALFLVVVFSDQLAVHTLAVGGLLPSILGALVASLLCYFLLFRPLAQCGLATRLSIEGVGASAFGTAGARWLPAPCSPSPTSSGSPSLSTTRPRSSCADSRRTA